jgi:hypothetical protein
MITQGHQCDLNRPHDRDYKLEVKREGCGGRAVTGDVAGDFADASQTLARRPWWYRFAGLTGPAAQVSGGCHVQDHTRHQEGITHDYSANPSISIAAILASTGPAGERPGKNCETAGGQGDRDPRRGRGHGRRLDRVCRGGNVRRDNNLSADGQGGDDGVR